jgi:5-formyltetrahydrofolate cyclo-ligase
MVNLTEQKKQLRQHFRKIRDGVQLQRGTRWGSDEKSMFWSFLSQSVSGFQGPVLSYFPIGSEPALLPQAMQPEAQLPWFFPALSGKNLWWFEWRPTDPLPGFSDKGLRESQSACDQTAAWQHQFGICFVPALAVDMRGHRLGYGGGYYDRFFASPVLRSNFLLVSCLHPCLMVKELPSEDHDIRVDMVVTHECVTTFGDTSQILKKLGTTKESKSSTPLF